jgi:hypothetical protein
MQDSRPPVSHRPASISNNLATVATVVGVGFMTLDVFFTVKRGISVFNTGDFLVNVAVAFLWAGFCAIAQKAAFSIFVDPRRKIMFDQMWKAGALGKLALITLGAIAIAAIHFSFSSTSVGLGINAKSLGISLPGQQFVASVGLIQFVISAFTGVMVAFLDEICFMCGELIKDA